MHLGIRIKMYGSFASVLLCVAAVGVIGWWWIGALTSEFHQLYGKNLQGAASLASAERGLWELRFGLPNYLMGDTDLRQKIKGDSNKWFTQVEEGIRAYAATQLTEAEQVALREFEQPFQSYAKVRPQYFELLDAGELEQAKAFRARETNPPAAKAVAALAQLISLQTELGAERERTISAMTQRLKYLLALIGLALGLGAALSILITRRFTNNLSRMSKIVEQVAAGNLVVQIDVDSRDEFGQLGQALNHMVKRLSDSLYMIGLNAQSLAGASEELTAVSQQMGANAEASATQANVVSAAAEQVSTSIQTVATAGEEMTASIKEIAHHASEAARVASTAVQVTEQTNAVITTLGTSSAEIGQVINVITSIAEQTNLLALNATIEAARAGEAGKGFAVVANEVKELAKQTAQATEDIRQKIGAIQGDTQQAVAAIGQITGIINQINDLQTTISSAVEEQSVTTSEITRNVSEAARGSAEIAQNIGGVAQAAQSTTSGANDSNLAAQELARMGMTLQQLVSQFHYDGHGQGHMGDGRASLPDDAYSNQGHHAQPAWQGRVEPAAIALDSNGNQHNSRGKRTVGHPPKAVAHA